MRGWISHLFLNIDYLISKICTLEHYFSSYIYEDYEEISTPPHTLPVEYAGICGPRGDNQAPRKA